MKCPCGKSLHYTDPQVKAVVDRFVKELGEEITFTIEGKSYRISRHYVALHGVKAAEIDDLVERKIAKPI